MDQADIADQIISEHLERAIAAARGIRSDTIAKSSAVNCIDCGDDIPVERRNAITGCTRCISCEEDYEYRKRKEIRGGTGQDAVDDIIDDILLGPV
jgi:phage/conjugal plasmid C-4 type zinc finger TraR family protein